jgi:transketolase
VNQAALALRVREEIVKMSGGGGCFIGASLSCADLLVHLYTEVLDVSPDRRADPHRDVLLLSKGHDVPALYATLAELGWFPKENLAHHLAPGHHLYWHPNRNIPGVEFHSGSLGHLPAVGLGIALDARLRKSPARTFVITGDGELDEGSVWEALLVASAQKADNLVLVVDRNGLQANMRTEELVPLEPLADKFRAFGASVRDADGHDFASLRAAFSGIPFEPGKPSVVIARTVRGKGLPSIEGRADRWFARFSQQEVRMLLEELHGNAPAALTSETLVVR